VLRQLSCALVCALLGVPASAQVGTGDIYGSVKDESGAVLPGASVTLSRPFTRSAISDARGHFRFLRVDAGTYRLTVSMTSFQTIERDVRVTTGENVTLPPFELGITAMEETLLVTAETPVVDPRRVGTQTTLDKAELVQVPNARDPWATLRTVPGVLVDRVNVGGTDNGQQALFFAKGAPSTENTWNIDGVQIDDMAAGGAAPTYFDYDFFEELAVSTGGNPVEVQTGGVGLNFVTRRGTNQWHGSVKGYLTHDDFQWSNIRGTELEDDPRLQREDGSFADRGNHVQQITDYGFDVGGPLIRDELFVYGLYGRQDIPLVRVNQERHKTLLETFTAKLNWQVSPSTSTSLFWFNGKKTINGRSGFAGLEQPDETIWDQGSAFSGFLPFGIQGMLKLEIDHVFSPSLILRANYTNYDNGFGIFARNGGPRRRTSSRASRAVRPRSNGARSCGR